MSVEARDPFTEGRVRAEDEDRFVLDLPNYDGPLDLLVELARARKIDISAISVLEIADQFLARLRQAKELRLELASDWLVMAATLTLLKSRMLVPTPPAERAEAEAAIEDLALRLRRLDAVRSVMEEIMDRRQLGIHWHRPVQGGADRGPAKRVDATLHGLLSEYVREARKTLAPPPAPVRQPFLVLSVEDAIRYLEETKVLGEGWQSLFAVVPPGRTVDKVHGRSKIAATYVAALELGKRGLVEIEQRTDEPLVNVRRRIG
jgi:Uncharacterized conserved protein